MRLPRLRCGGLCRAVPPAEAQQAACPVTASAKSPHSGETVAVGPIQAGHKAINSRISERPTEFVQPSLYGPAGEEHRIPLIQCLADTRRRGKEHSLNTRVSPAPIPPQGRLGLLPSPHNPPGRPAVMGDDRRPRRGVAGSGCVPGCGGGGRSGAISSVRGHHVAIQEHSANLRVRSSNLFGRATKFLEIQA